jgi:uncharacterized protein
MKIGVLSDSHGDLLAIEKAILALKDCNMVYHLGDYVKDCKVLKKKLDVPIIAIRGNCDHSAEGILEKVEQVEGINIFLTHGHNYGVKLNTFKLRYKALETDSNIALYGHTHIRKIEKEEGIYYINPGSISEPRSGYKPSVAIIEINNTLILPRLVEI